MQSLYLLLPPVVQTNVLPIKETVRPWKIVKGAHKIGNRKRRSHAEGQLPHPLYSPNENRNMERREKHQKISGEARNLEITIDGTNKMRDMS